MKKNFPPVIASGFHEAISDLGLPEDNSRLTSSTFRYLLLAISISVFLLIVIGIMVSVAEWGSACPDWPTCYGHWTPPQEPEALVNYLHRLLAGLSGMLLLLGTILAWRQFPRIGWISLPLTVATAALFAQGLLGVTVINKGASPALSALHLALALVVQALVLVPAVTAFYRGRSPLPAVRLVFRSPFARISLVALGGIFALLVSGTLVSATGVRSACSSWPLCNGALIPADAFGWINLGHRLISAAAGILLAALLVQAWRTQRSQTGILVSSTAAVVLFFAQVSMGALEVSRDFPAALRGLHVATAAAVWAVLVVQVALTGLAARKVEEERREASAWSGHNGLAKNFLLLTKPIVVSLLLVTTFAGMVVGAQAWPSLRLAFWTLLGGALAAGGCGAINQYIDRYDDVKMQRTARRPIPSGQLTPGEGLAFGVALCLASFYLMAALVNFLAALLTLAGIIYYVLIYSLLLKKATVQNIVIGGGAGAIPPLVGWAAATGHLNIPSLFLFAVIFMWTPPHFWALALVRRNDYARAGVPMLPVVRGERETRWQIFIYSVELVALTLVLPLFGLGGAIYLVSATFLGGGLLFSAWKVWQGEGNKVAWRMYRFSSMYLAFLFLALMVDALI